MAFYGDEARRAGATIGDVIELTRTVRFATGLPSAEGGEPPAHNSHAGHPSMRGLARHDEIDVACQGEADSTTGYLINIKEIDQAVRSRLVPIIDETVRRAPQTEPGEMLPRLGRTLRDALEVEVSRIRWRLTPTYSVALNLRDMNTVLIQQRFEFAAAHRLHVPTFSDEQNRELFGKCNNPAGHGHNYALEPEVEVELDGGGRQPLTLRDLERIVDEAVIQRLDHKHLNHDVPEFEGVNPSVEAIAKVCYEMLDPALRREHPDARLRRVTVWETEKTRCAYPAE